MDTAKRLQEVQHALGSPAEAIYVFTVHDGSLDHSAHYVDACVALKRRLRNDEFYAAALSSVTMQVASVSDFNIDNAVFTSGAAGIKRHIFRNDDYAFTGDYFKGMNRQEVLLSLVRILKDCGLLCKTEYLPEQVVRAVQANQLAVPAAGYFLVKVALAMQQGCECWYSEDGSTKSVVL